MLTNIFQGIVNSIKEIALFLSIVLFIIFLGLSGTASNQKQQKEVYNKFKNDCESVGGKVIEVPGRYSTYQCVK